MPFWVADAAADEARKDGETLSGLPVRVLADEDRGVFAVASGAGSAAEFALRRLQEAPAGPALEALRLALAPLPSATEVTAILLREGTAAFGQRGQHPLVAVREGRLLWLTASGSVADDPRTLVKTAPGLFTFRETEDLALAAASRAALTAEQMGFLRAQRASTLEVRRLEAVPETTYLLLSQTVARALGSDVLFALAEAQTGPWALLRAARTANPSQRRGMGAVVVRVS